MEGYALLLCFRLGLIRASSYRPNQNHTTTFILKVTILAKAINRKKPFCLACGSPLKPILRRTALQAAFVVGYLYPRALPPVTHGSALQAPECLWGTDDVLPSRHRSACDDVSSYPW